MFTVPALDDVEVFRPFTAPDFHVGRVAVRSEAFAATSASGGRGVLIGSAAGRDPDVVRIRARAELVERVSNVLAGRHAEVAAEVRASFTELRRRGLPTADPAWWRPDDPLHARRLRQLWVWGRNTKPVGDPVLVPASVVYLHHRPPAGCALLLRATSTGLAADADPANATAHALREIHERDLLVRCWYLDHPLSAVDLESAVPAEGRAWIHTLGLQVAILRIDGDNASCILAAVHDAHGGQQSFGARGLMPGEDLAAAGTDAVGEALMVRWSMRTAVAHAAWRRLLDGAGGQPAAVVPADPLEHAVAAYYGSGALTRLVSGRTGDRPPPSYPAPITVDTSTGGDLRVVRVLVPGALDLSALTTGRLGAETGCPPHPFG